MTRGGDVTAILLNGYPIIKTEMAKHGDIERAVNEFQKFTEKTQQSPSRANLSVLQRSKSPFARTFFRFKNTTNQLVRLQTDATIQYLNKQITAKDFVGQTLTYSIYTPMAYVMAGYLVKEAWQGIFGEDDDDENLLGDIFQQIIVQPFQALPFLDEIANAAFNEIRKKTTGEDYYMGDSLFNLPVLDDMTTAFKKLSKEEPSAEDLLRALSLIQEPITGMPTETILRYYRYTQPEKDDILSGYFKSNTKTKSLDKYFE